MTPEDIRREYDAEATIVMTLDELRETLGVDDAHALREARTRWEAEVMEKPNGII